MRSRYWVVVALGVGILTGMGLGAAGPRTGLALLRLAVDLAGALTIGFQLSAAVLLPPGRDGVVSRAGRSHLRLAGVAAGSWALAALAAAAATLADTLGGWSVVFHRGVIRTYLWSVPTAKALIVVAVIAVVIAVVNWFTTTTGLSLITALGAAVAIATPVIAGHDSTHALHSLALTAGVAHALLASAWLGLAVAVGTAVATGAAAATAAGSALLRSSSWFALAVGATGVADAWSRLSAPSQLVTTSYGRLVLVGAALLVGLGALAAFGPRGLQWQGPLLAAALAPMVFLTATPYPRPSITYPTYAETIVGRAFPGQPDAVRLLFGAAPDPFFVFTVALGVALYFVGLARLRRRGDRWPALRTAAWFTGLLVLLWGTCGGVAAYAPFSFSAHMLQHMTLSMVAPILLTLGAPVTLLLRATSAHHGERRGAREWVVWAVHTPFSRFVSHPIYVLAVYTVGLYGLYFTSLFNYLMHSHVGHLAMQLHFLFAGLLFYWVVIGIDPGPRRVPHWARLLLVMITAVIHAFFALAMMLATHPLVGGWYWLVRPPWLADPLHDQYVGGGIAWAFGEVPTMLVLIALAVQWARSDDRNAARNDRQADRDGDAELNAYNEQLARLARHNTR